MIKLTQVNELRIEYDMNKEELVKSNIKGLTLDMPINPNTGSKVLDLMQYRPATAEIKVGGAVNSKLFALGKKVTIYAHGLPFEFKIRRRNFKKGIIYLIQG